MPESIALCHYDQEEQENQNCKTFGIIITTCGKFWHIITTYGKFWHFFAAYGNLWFKALACIALHYIALPI